MNTEAEKRLRRVEDHGDPEGDDDVHSPERVASRATIKLVMKRMTKDEIRALADAARRSMLATEQATGIRQNCAGLSDATGHETRDPGSARDIAAARRLLEKAFASKPPRRKRPISALEGDDEDDFMPPRTQPDRG
jgi:hypothetical protein